MRYTAPTSMLTKDPKMIRGSMAVRSVGHFDLAALFTYLDEYLRDNGANGTPLFCKRSAGPPMNS